MPQRPGENSRIIADSTMNGINIAEFKYSDLHFISKWRSDPRINQFIRSGIRTLDEVSRWYHDYFHGEKNRLYLISFDTHPIGYFTIEGIDHVKMECEFGIVIGEVDFQQRGIGLSVINMMLEKAFNDMGMQRIIAVIHEDNTVSIRCFKKAGFTLENGQRVVKRSHNGYKVILSFSIKKDEWCSRNIQV